MWLGLVLAALALLALLPRATRIPVLVCWVVALVNRRNARIFARTLPEELQILVLHGLLHLAGMDHESDSGEMARAERKLRKQFGLPANLIERMRA